MRNAIRKELAPLELGLSELSDRAAEEPVTNLRLALLINNSALSSAESLVLQELLRKLEHWGVFEYESRAEMLAAFEDLVAREASVVF